MDLPLPALDTLSQRPPSPLTVPHIGEQWQSPMEKVEELCSSNDLSLPALREIVESHTFRDLNSYGYPFFDKVCNNENVTLEIIQYLLVCFPNAMGRSTLIMACMNESCPNKVIELLVNRCLLLRQTHILRNSIYTSYQCTPLHYYLARKSSIALEVVQLLINAWPEANRITNSCGYMPIHILCDNKQIDEAVSLDVLRFMHNTDRTLLREAVEGWLPIHIAVGHMSTVFCKELISSYPESLKVGDADDILPIHLACMSGRADSVDTIQYLLSLYPKSICARDGLEHSPIHRAILWGTKEVVELLLILNPADASMVDEDSGKFLLHVVASCNRPAGLVSKLKTIFDAYPEAILARDRQGKTPLDHAMRTWVSQSMTVISFLQAQQVYAQIAQNTAVLTSVDESGWLPLHRALKDNATLGSIKLLVTGLLVTRNAASLQLPTHDGIFPMQIACEYSSVKVVKLLHELSGHTLDQFSPLHYACRGGNCAVIQYLFDSHASLVASAVVTPDGNGKLPIHLLCQAGKEEDKVDCNSPEYVEAIWLILSSNPVEMVTALVG